MIGRMAFRLEAVLAFAGWASLDANARWRQVGIVVRHAEEADVDFAAVELEWRRGSGAAAPVSCEPVTEFVVRRRRHLFAERGRACRVVETCRRRRRRRR